SRDTSLISTARIPWDMLGSVSAIWTELKLILLRMGAGDGGCAAGISTSRAATTGFSGSAGSISATGVSTSRAATTGLSGSAGSISTGAGGIETGSGTGFGTDSGLRASAGSLSEVRGKTKSPST